MTEPKTSFPILPEKWWWAIRDQFKKTIPQTNVRASYLSTVLNIAPDTAAKIALPTFKKVRLLDQNGKPSERAIRWRDDQQYPEVCKEMLHQIYPQELLEAAPDPASDRATAERWFANVTGSGQSSVTKMVSFYQLLCEADPNKRRENAKRSSTNRSPKTKLSKNGSSLGAANRMPKSVSIPQYRPAEATTATASMPSAIEMLMRSLPPEGTPLPTWRRNQWLRMASEVLAFLYPSEENDMPDEDDVEE